MHSLFVFLIHSLVNSVDRSHYMYLLLLLSEHVGSVILPNSFGSLLSPYD